MAHAGYIFLIVLGLYLLHELIHMLTASIIGLEINGVGATTRPYPHLYVSIVWPKSQIKKYIYLFCSPIVTAILFAVHISFDIPNSHLFTYAFIIQIIMETNPFYSDFTIALFTRNVKWQHSQKVSYKEMFLKHQFSRLWYFHFIIWGCIIIFLASLI